MATPKLLPIALCLLLAAMTGHGLAEEKITPKEKPTEWGANDPDWTVDVPNWQPVAPGEHPRLVFRKADIARLKQRAETPEGKVIMAKLHKLLDGPMTLSHPAGLGLLYQLTGDKRLAEQAKTIVADIIDKSLTDSKDKRYAFYRAGKDPEMRVGPAIWIMGLSYDLNYDGWDEAFRKKVALAIQDHQLGAKIAKRGPICPSCNHFGAAVGGVATGLLAIKGDPGTDDKKVQELLDSAIKQVREDISKGRGDRGYFFEGHQCGRISSNTGITPFLQAYRVAAGKDLVTKKDNARWDTAKWIYEFARDPDGKFTNPQRGMYCRNFPRGGMWSENGDFALGFGVVPAEYVPALKWVYENQIEPGDKTYDVFEFPTQAIYALANWPIDVKAVNPDEQPELFPRVLADKGSGYHIFRNGWSNSGKDIVVSALLGTHTNGRGMASGGSVYVYGKGLGWAGQFAKYRFPGIFYGSYPIYSKFEKDGSGVISAITYSTKFNSSTLNPAETSSKPTSLAVDFSGACGAELLVAMAGSMVGYQVEYWMQTKQAAFADVTGQDGYATKTTEVKLGGARAYVMTLQKGAAPEVKQDGESVMVGKRKLSFDGVKIVLE